MTQIRKPTGISPIGGLMFAVAATSFIDYSLVGRVTVGESLAFASVPFLWSAGNRSLLSRNLSRCIAILAVFFAGTVVSDIVNENTLTNAARAAARPVFALGHLLFFLPALARDPGSFRLYIYGRVIGALVNVFRPSEFEAAGAGDLSQYQGVVFRLSPLVSAVGVASAVYFYRKHPNWSVVALIATAVTQIAIGGGRSSVLTWLLAGTALMAVRILHDRKKAGKVISNRKWKAIATAGFAGLIFIYYAYTYAAPRGMLGELQRTKYANQTSSIYGDSPLGLIVTGRAEAYGAILGIAERPLFGFGSWRHDLTQPYLFKAIRLVGRGGPDPRETSGGKVRGAGHSVLLQAWVENGMLPAIALIAVLVLILRVAWFNARYDTIYTPYFIVSTIGFSWGFLFSPPGLGLRVTIGLFMAFYVVFMDTKSKSVPLQAILRRNA